MTKTSFLIGFKDQKLPEIFAHDNLRKSLPEDLVHVTITLIGDIIQVDALIPDDQEIFFPRLVEWANKELIPVKKITKKKK